MKPFRIYRNSKRVWVSLSDMRISERAQRQLNVKRSLQIAAVLDINALSYPTLNHRGGHYWIINAMHRLEALKQWLTEQGKDWTLASIECEVFEGLSEKEEADLFDKLNTMTPVNTDVRFSIQVVAERPKPMAITAIVEAAGLRVGRVKAPEYIQSSSALRRANELGVLEPVLSVCRDAYGVFPANLIRGAAEFFYRFDAVDVEIVSSILANAPGGWNGLNNRADAQLLRMKKRNKPIAVGYVLWDTLRRACKLGAFEVDFVKERSADLVEHATPTAGAFNVS